MKWKNIVLAVCLSLVSLCGCSKKENEEQIEEVNNLTIDKIEPAQNLAGSDIVITGTGFNTNPTSNIVKINNINAIVKSSTTTTLLVRIPNSALTGKIEINNGSFTTYSNDEYLITQASVKSLKIKTYQDGDRYEYWPVYDASNRIISMTKYFNNPINRLLIYQGIWNYTYDTDGLLTKCVYTPYNPATLEQIDYFYTSGTLSTVRISTINATNPSSTVKLLHTIIEYEFIGGQPLKFTTKNINGEVISRDDFVYSNVNGKRIVVIKTTFPSAPSISETLEQFDGVISPYALHLSLTPARSLYMVAKRTSTEDSVNDYSSVLGYRGPQSAGIVTDTQEIYPNRSGQIKRTIVTYE
ncbi:hypothetical protein QFZ20_004633 [Flavobacterium sp. W4I14]|nr:hypothetical protein [Flavobacterium sp. W4I14]